MADSAQTPKAEPWYPFGSGPPVARNAPEQTAAASAVAPAVSSPAAKPVEFPSGSNSMLSAARANSLPNFDVPQPSFIDEFLRGGSDARLGNPAASAAGDKSGSVASTGGPAAVAKADTVKPPHVHVHPPVPPRSAFGELLHTEAKEINRANGVVNSAVTQGLAVDAIRAVVEVKLQGHAKDLALNLVAGAEDLSAISAKLGQSQKIAGAIQSAAAKATDPAHATALVSAKLRGDDVPVAASIIADVASLQQSRQIAEAATSSAMAAAAAQVVASAPSVSHSAPGISAAVMEQAISSGIGAAVTSQQGTPSELAPAPASAVPAGVVTDAVASGALAGAVSAGATEAMAALSIPEGAMGVAGSAGVAGAVASASGAATAAFADVSALSVVEPALGAPTVDTLLSPAVVSAGAALTSEAAVAMMAPSDSGAVAAAAIGAGLAAVSSETVEMARDSAGLATAAESIGSSPAAEVTGAADVSHVPAGEAVTAAVAAEIASVVSSPAASVPGIDVASAAAEGAVVGAAMAMVSEPTGRATSAPEMPDTVMAVASGAVAAGAATLASEVATGVVAPVSAGDSALVATAAGAGLAESVAEVRQPAVEVIIQPIEAPVTQLQPPATPFIVEVPVVSTALSHLAGPEVVAAEVASREAPVQSGAEPVKHLAPVEDRSSAANPEKTLAPVVEKSTFSDAAKPLAPVEERSVAAQIEHGPGDERSVGAALTGNRLDAPVPERRADSGVRELLDVVASTATSLSDRVTSFAQQGLSKTESAVNEAASAFSAAVLPPAKLEVKNERVSLEDALTTHMREKGFDSQSIAAAGAIAKEVGRDSHGADLGDAVLVLHKEGQKGDPLATVVSAKDVHAVRQPGDSVLALDTLEKIASRGLDTAAVSQARGANPELARGQTDLELSQSSGQAKSAIRGMEQLQAPEQQAPKQERSEAAQQRDTAMSM